MKTMEERLLNKIGENDNVFTALSGNSEIDKNQAVEQLRRAIQLFAQTLTNDEAMEIATVYPKYEVGKNYNVGVFITYGKNDTGDPQLYKIIQDHTSQEDWKPSDTPALYEPIGLTEDGYVKWSQPAGAHDTYSKGQIVWYQDQLYISTVDNNIYAPGVVVGAWEAYEN